MILVTATVERDIQIRDHVSTIEQFSGKCPKGNCAVRIEQLKRDIQIGDFVRTINWFVFISVPRKVALH